jgi:hypothetical protein
MEVESYVARRVHSLFWDHNDNCAVTTLKIGSELFALPLERQVVDSALGLWGAGGFRAQCGLVEGGLMLFGLLGSRAGLSRSRIGALCGRYADEFVKRFGALTCRDLRPDGFRSEDPPHRCEELACRTVTFTCRELRRTLGLNPRVPPLPTPGRNRQPT